MSRMMAPSLVGVSKWPASRRRLWATIGLVVVALCGGAAVFAIPDASWRLGFLLLQIAATLTLGTLAVRKLNAAGQAAVPIAPDSVEPSAAEQQAGSERPGSGRHRGLAQQLTDGIEGLTDGFALFDADDRLVFCNAKYRALSGGTSDVVRPGVRFEDILRAHVGARLEPLAIGREDAWIAHRLAQHRDAQGTFERFVNGHWYRFSDRPTSDGGIVTIFAQIDELKQREQRLRESQAILQSILDNIPVTVSITDRDRRIVLINREIEELYGVKLKDVVGQRVTDVRPPRFSSDTAEEDHYEVIRTGKAINSREDHYFSDLGEETWISSVVPIKDDEGSVKLVLRTTMAVPQLARANRELADNRAFLIEAERQARIASWYQSSEMNERVYWSENVEAVIGYTPAQVASDSAVLAVVHPADRDRMSALFAEVSERPRSYDCEYRVVRPDGSTVWVHGITKVELDPHGRLTRFIGTIQDVTAQKSAAEALRESQEFLLTAERRAKIACWTQTVGEVGGFVDKDLAAYVLGITRAEMPKNDAAYVQMIHPEDRGRALEAYRKADQEHLPYSVEYRLIRQDGSIVWIRDLAEFQTDADGKPTRMIGTIQDVTDQKRVDEALRDSEARLRAFLDHAPAIMYLKDREGRYQIVNREFERAENVTAGEIRGRTLRDLKPRQARTSLAEQDREVLETERISVRELGDYWEGVFKHLIVVKFPVRDATGNVVGIGCYAQDITERKRAEEALRASEARMKAFVDNAPVFISVKDRDRRFMMINRKVSMALGVSAEEVIGKTTSEILPGGGADSIMEMEKQVLETGQTVSREVYLPERVSAPWTLEVKFPISDALGEVIAVGGVAIDISARKKAELALADSEARFHSFMDYAPFDMYVKDLGGRYLMVNDGAEISWCRPKAEILGRTVRELSSSGGVQEVEDIEREVLDTGKAVVREVHFTDLGPEWTHEVKFPIKDAAGNIIHIGAVAVDISDRKKIELALAESERRLRRAQRQARLAYWSTDLAISAIEWSPGSGPIFGISDADMPTAEAAYNEFIHPDDRERVKRLYEGLRSTLNSYSIEYRLLRPDGTNVWVRELGDVEIDVDGNRVAVHGTLQDITDRRALEEQLQQSQKMEAIGQLTGGIAHDFNNLLAIILGNLDLLNEQKDMGFSTRRKIETSIKAGLRAADLTHRLLAFARRQALMPKPTDINALIRSMAPLLQRPLGPKISMTFGLTSDIWAAEVDPSQLEMALLNLTLNARDAMPEGGSLTINTGNAAVAADAASGIPAGDYVVISVEDTGVGMSDEVRARAFDPFFTTKGVGKGTGLGLSMVYGFVNQSGGHVHIDSQQGKGTKVIIHLAKSTGPIPKTAADDETPVSAGRQETILLVEDEADVRTLAETYLETFGYSVISAFDGPTALAALDTNQKIDLLLTDIILPGPMDGIAIATEVRARRPDIKILYISGFAPDADQLLPDTELIRKPFLQADLSRAIRDALDDKRRK
jgi:PAS domain S-box-containing protein